MNTFKKIGKVLIFGVECPVMQRDDGRLFAGESITEERPYGGDGRQWNAMTLEILTERIKRTESITAS